MTPKHSSHSSAILSHLTVYEISLQLSVHFVSRRYRCNRSLLLRGSLFRCFCFARRWTSISRNSTRGSIIFLFLRQLSRVVIPIDTSRDGVIASKLCNYSCIMIVYTACMSIHGEGIISKTQASSITLSFSLFPLTVAAEEPKAAEGGQPR